MAGAIDAIENAIEDEEWEEADRTMQRKGIKVEKDTPTYAALAQAILTAKLEAMYGARRAMRGQATETPAAFTPHGFDSRTLQPRVRETAPPNLATTPRAPAIKLRGGVGFLEASERFLAERQRDPKAKRRKHSLRPASKSVPAVPRLSKYAPLVAVDRKMAAGFIDTVATLSPKWGQSPRAKGLRLDVLLKEYGGQLSNSSLNHYASAMKSFFDWAFDRGDFIGDNPFARQSRETTVDGWKPYTITELNQLFGGPVFTNAKDRLRPNADPMLWVPLVALYSGLRVEEICLLRREDVKQDGVWYFNVSSEGEGQKLKSKAAMRRVPMHPG